MYSKSFYKFIRATAIILYKPFKRLTVIGNVNIDRPSIILCNHISLDDPIILAMVLKTEPKFVAKKELFNNKIAAWFLTKMGCISINRQSADISAVRTSMECIKNGQSLVIFPEGKRNRDKRCRKEDAKGGVGLIAAATKADIIPCSIYTKGYHARFPQKSFVQIGEPIKYEEYIAACEDKRDIGVYAFAQVERQLIEAEAKFN